MVSESEDGVQWSTVATLNETDISTDAFSHFGAYALNEETRYVRWLLAAAESGNTQLNNIVITKHEPSDTSIDDPGPSEPDPYPNPTQSHFRWDLCDDGLVIRLYDATGVLVRQWENVAVGDNLNITGIAPGYYTLRATTSAGHITKKLVIR
jgi:hypothetical protein